VDGFTRDNAAFVFVKLEIEEERMNVE